MQGARGSGQERRSSDRNIRWAGVGQASQNRLMCPAHYGNGEVSAVGRITAVLEAFRDDRDALALSELARRAGLPKTTVHRLAGELIRCGLLERADGRLRLGLKLFELGQLVTQPRAIHDDALPLHDDLPL